MNVSRLLLPFTHGVDLPAIEYTVRLAHYCGATLVALSRKEKGEIRPNSKNVTRNFLFLEHLFSTMLLKERC